MSDAYLGYSLLYPYTDNYLDDESIPTSDKKTFQDLFTQRLAGHNGKHCFVLIPSTFFFADYYITNAHTVKARSALEQKIWDMVTKVESKDPFVSTKREYDAGLLIILFLSFFLFVSPRCVR